MTPTQAFAETQSGTGQDDSVSIVVEIPDRNILPGSGDGDLPGPGLQIDLVPLTAAGLVALSVGIILTSTRRSPNRARQE